MGCRLARHGFTLIELMIVVTVISILAAAIMPTLARSLQTTSLRVASRALVDVFGYAYSTAVTRGVDVRVCFDATERRCWLEAEAREAGRPLPATGARQPFERVSLPGGLPLRLGSGVRLAVRLPADRRVPIAGNGRPGPTGGSPLPATGAAITFYPDGTADDAEVVLANEAGRECTVWVCGVTGRARIEEERPHGR